MFRRVSLAVLFISTVSTGPAQPAAASEDFELFESRIRPMLVDRCYSCHNSAGTADGGLAVDSRDGLLTGGDSGPAIVAGDPAASLLLSVLRHEVDGIKMPKDSGKLDAATLADVATWIAAGAPDPRDAPPTADELAKATSWDTIMARRRQWWSFQPLAGGASPDVPNNTWSEHPVDRHILAALREKGLEPAADATPQTLVRRLFFVLTGLPPTADETVRWTARLAEPQGFEALVDHLLASPHFGERWARHWMDWIRYSDTHGSEGDPEIVGTAHYRDYLIRAINADVPFDQLLREHVAGDLLQDPRYDASGTVNESAIGPAHFRMVFHGYSPTDALDEKVRFVDDQIGTFSKAFLGLTVSCARCHDHKFDPISQADYYALFGVLGSCRPGRLEIATPDVQARHQAELAALKPAIRQKIATQWLDSLPALAARMEAADAPWRTAEKASSLMHPLYAAEQARTDGDGAEGKSEAEVVQGQIEAWAAARTQRTGSRETPSLARWQFGAGNGEADDAAKWFRSGSGLKTASDGSTDLQSDAGDFAIAPEGPKAISRVWPASVKTHTLSTKHGGRFTSPTMRLDKEYSLRVLAAGGDGATLRPVIQNYTRLGRIYPLDNLSPEWKWYTYDLDYWTGDDIHVELATSRDMPLPLSNRERSWFSVREAVLVEKQQPAPPSIADEKQAAILDEALATRPQTAADLRACYLRALERSIRAWMDGTASDSQALLLDACVGEELLENTIEKLADALPLIETYRRLEAEIVPAERVPAMEESVGRDQPLLARGDHKKPGDSVPRGFLSVIDATPYRSMNSGRLQLASDLLRQDNPLTRRVIANRIWHHVFGRGLAATPDNLGHLGPTPTHPALLDELARYLETNGWSLKTLIRHIVTSRTWRLDSQANSEASLADPENRLLSHAFVRRLEAESVRDSLLAASGSLDRKMFGSMQPGGGERRSVYVRVARNAIDPLLRVFDFPEPASSVGCRDVTNVPAQALYLLNDKRITELARTWAEQILADGSLATDDDRLQKMFVSALGRSASPEELSRTRQLLASTQQDTSDSASRLASIRAEQAALTSTVSEVFTAARVRVSTATTTGTPVPAPPGPMSRWDFAKGLDDLLGGMAVTLRDGARVDGGSLVLAGTAHAVTAPLSRSLREKTLVAWVQLSNLEQRGGGVMTIQTSGGERFDAIVFGEQVPGEWLAGSDHYLRTKPFGGSPEKEAVSRPVHLAVTYTADGTIRGYRNGMPYGKPYRSESPSPQEFASGETIVSFGVRHLPAQPDRMLSGQIFSAALYDRALGEQDVQADFMATAQGAMTDEQVFESLQPSERQRVVAARTQLEKLQALAASLVEQTGEKAISDPRLAGWTEVGRAIFLLKEFIYLR